jgi:16S rRNA (guanine527-N7)-methyltransferase
MGILASDEAIARLVRFAAILEDRAIREGFLGPNEATRIVPRHVLESCAIVPLLPPEGPLIDIGSGAGLPGIPVACLRGEPVTLVDSNERRSRYLSDVLAELGLSGEAAVGRAEDLARSPLREAFAAATCRALAPPPVVLELCLPFVAVGGVLVWPLTPEGTVAERIAGGTADSTATHGVGGDAGAGRVQGGAAAAGEVLPSSSADLGAIRRVAEQLGGGDPKIVGLEVPGADAARWAMIVHKFNETPERFPRRTGVPARRPLE